MKKRVLSTFMALALCLTLLPVPAWADEDTHMHAGTGDSVYTVDADTVVQSTENSDANAEENAVAEVTAGDVTTQYATLAKAIEAAQDATSATVKLLANVKTDSQIVVGSGTFTIDLNGKNWDRSSGNTLRVNGGSVTVTSSEGTGTISNSENNAIYVAANATVHVEKGVRLSRLYAEKNANLTLDVGVIITDTLYAQTDNIAPFLTGKALKACDEQGNTTENKYVSIYENYDTDGEKTGCVIVIEHKSCDDTPCPICGYDGTQTKPTEPEDSNVAEVSGTKYKTLAEAVKAANGADITLLKIFGENVVVEDGAKADIILGNGGTIEDEGTYPSNWMADSNGTPLTMNAGEITLKSGVLSQGKSGADNNIAIKLKGGTLTVADTVTKIIGGSVDITSKNTAQMAAIEATGGTLDLQGNTHLDGGLIMRDNAKLANKLTAGIFTNSGSSTASVSVKGNTSSYPQVADSKEYTTVFDLLAEGYVFVKYNADGMTGDVIAKNDSKSLTEDVTVIKCTHKGANNKSLFKDDTCAGCGLTCTHKTVENNICTVCNTAMGAKDSNDKYYVDLADAIEGVAVDGTVTLLADVEEDITIADGTDVTIDLNGKTWKGFTWHAAVPLTVSGGSVTLQNGKLEQGGASSYANTAIVIKGGSLTVGEDMTIRGGKYASSTVLPAITVESGSLTLAENTGLYGGMKVPADKTLADYLPAGTAFVQIPDDGAGSFVNGYVQELTGNFTLSVEKHTHFVGSDSKCACGFVCAHSSFTDGKCSVCGYECTHPSATEADGKYTCDTCKQQMVVKVTKGDKITYYAERHNAYNDETLWWLFNNALESGSTVTLLADNLVAWAYVSNGKQITLDLNGKTLEETSQGITVGRDNDTDTNNNNNKLIVTGTLGAGEVAKDNCYAFRTWEGGELNLKEVADGGKIGSIIADGGKVTTEDSTSDMKIGTLYINDGSTQISLKGGTFDKICFSSIGGGSVKLGDLLAEENPIQKSGKAFKHTGEDGAFVPYDTVIDSSNAVKNVTITDCPHDSITSGPNSDGITCGTCTYCGMDNIAAVLTDANGSIQTFTINNGSGEIFNPLSSTGGTLKLYRDLTCNETLGTEGGTTEMVIDLNGHTISLPTGATGQEVTLNGGSLTITDSSKDKTGKFASTLNVSGTASLTVDGVKMGTIGLQSETASITLKEGTTFTGYEKPSGTMLAQWIEDGDCISGLSSSIDAYTDKSESGSFAVEKAPAAFSTPVKSGTIRYNGLMPEEVIPGITLDAGSNVSYVDMQWYYSKGGSFNMMNQNGTIYPNAPENTWRGNVSSSPVFKNFKIGDTISDVFCVLTASDGSWSTVLRGYEFTLETGDLSEATVTVTSAADDLVYWNGDATGTPKTHTLAFNVTHNASWNTLKEDTDYTIQNGSNTAADAGEHTLVLVGIGNYAGSKLEYKWTIAPLTLGELVEQNTIQKDYDGTANLPDDFVFTPSFLMNGSYYVLKDSDYTVEGSYDSAAAGENKTAALKLTLTGENYRFSNGEKTMEVTVSKDCNILKADAPAAQEGALTVINHHADSYEFGLSGLLPALENGREYGAISYGEPVINLNSGYYTSGVAIDANGVLTLPVQKNETDQEGAVGTVTIPVTSTNYKDFALTINVSATNKIVPTGAPTLSKTTLTYGEKLSSITLSGGMQDGKATVQGTFAWTQPDAAPAAGTYTAEWRFTPAESSKYMEITGTADVAVNKATPSGAPKYTAITTSSKTLADAALTTVDGTFSVPGTVAWELPDTTEVTANTAYKWVFTPTDTDNYNEISGSITLYSVSTGGGGGGSTTTNTETTTNPDGSTTKTETKSDGTVVETTTNKDGSTTKTESKTETKSDGSTVETVTETRTEADGSKTETKSETKTETDGTKTETKSETSTAKDGTKTETKSETKTETDGTKTETKSETTTAKDGTKTETKSETKTDANGVTSGTETSTTTAANGSTGTTTTVIENGVSKTEAEAKISDKAVSDAKKSDEAVKIPTEVKVGEDSASAPTVKIDLPKNSGETKIEIPVKDVSAGTVAVIVHPDGTEELIKESLPTEGGVQLTVDGSVTVKIVDNAKDFKDTKNHWAADSIDFVSARGLVNGTGGDSFDPNAASTRAQLWTILARRIGADLTGGASWYEKAQEWAKTNGISDGSAPNSSITRAQMVTMLWRAAGSPKADGANAFNDVPTGSYYVDAIAWAAAHGITTGVGNGAFDPNGTCTRAQIAAFLHRSYLSE